MKYSQSTFLSLLFALLSNTAMSTEEVSIGNSLFDQLFAIPDANGYEYDLPYPFEKLVQRLEASLGPGPGQSGGSVSALLIPRGRSLQREAASPAYYRFPRIVLALDRAAASDLLVKHRLFMGYQEQSRSIEVISYNETEGRFEFQLVENYAPGEVARVSFANRHLCTSCHQNEAPLFARPLWRESNFNAEVAERIGRFHQSYHGIPVAARKGEATRVDFATDEAGLFSAYQEVWRSGCSAGADSDEMRARQCRAAIFLAALQHALASVAEPQYQSRLVNESLGPSLEPGWQQRWPQGMPVHSADIDDRPAFPAGTTPGYAPALDPLSLRAPLANWTYQAGVVRTIRGLADNFLLPKDLQRLAIHLERLSASDKSQPGIVNGDCSLEAINSARTSDLTNSARLNCSAAEAATGQLFQINLVLGLDSDMTIHPAASHILISGQGQRVRLQVEGKLKPSEQGIYSLTLKSTSAALGGRLWDNRLITDAVLSLPLSIFKPTPENGKSAVAPNNASIHFQLRRDLELLESAIQRLLTSKVASHSARDSGKHGQIFSNRPIDGRALMQSLLQTLGAAPGSASSLALRSTKSKSNAQQPGPPVTELGSDSMLASLLRHCGECHAADTKVPPGFLHGDQSRIRSQLGRCATRISRRLSAWHLPATALEVAPMPPPASLLTSNTGVDQWRQSDELRNLQNYIAELIAENRTEGFNTIPYEQLPTCADN